jgi:hypothetical protein
MREIRALLAWIFAAACVLNVLIVGQCLSYLIRYSYTPSQLRGVIVSALVSGAVLISSGGAWWTVWNRKHSARSWGITASLMSVVIFVRPFVFPTQPVWDHHFGALIIGIVGLAAFSSRDRARSF